jgi:formate dehydrogenase major subunit/formate dehydrogenase alpha subunit
MTNSIGEIADAKAIFIIGSNTSETHPVISYRVREAVRKGAVLIVADPRVTEMAKLADYHLRLRPGTDVALLNGLMHIIIAEDLLDVDFIEKRTEGFEKLKEKVAEYTPERVAEITGVAVSDLRAAARAYATAENAAILYTMGITQHTTGTDNVLSVANLAMLTGNVGKPSSGVNPLRGQNNVQGACDMGGLPNVFTGYQRVGDPQVQEKFAQAWGVPLSDKPGLTVTKAMNAIHEGKIKGMLIMGENPVLSEANANHAAEALEKLEFLVVQDIFMTETAAYADVVLPAAAYAEKLGTYTNTERRVQLSYPAVPPPGEARPDWEILVDLANRLGFNWSYSGPEAIFNEMASLTPSYAGMSYQRLAENRSLQWPCPDKDHPGTPYLHVGKFSRGLGQFTPVDYKPPAELPDEEYPFVLSTGRHLFHYHTGTMTRRSAPLEQHRPEELVEIHPEDAARLGLEEGDRARISSRRGEVVAKVTLTERVKPGHVFMTFHYREAAANLLTNDAFCPVATTPELKVCAVNVEKAD